MEIVFECMGGGEGGGGDVSPGLRRARQAAKRPSVALHVTTTLQGCQDIG
jgi:hypothetical protein